MKNPLDLTGRTILVTGASSGIGRSTAVLLSQLGARVVLAARNQERLRQTAEALEGSGHEVEPIDLAELEKIPDWLAGVAQKAGPLAGLVHCAGMASLMPLRVLTMRHLETVMRVNFQSAVALTTAFSRKRVHQAGSSVVLVASVAASCGVPARSAYSASKGALVAFARSAALELAKTGLRVNCVAPAYVRTEMYEESLGGLTPEQLQSVVEATQPLGLGEPADVANAIAFLLADTGRWITGSVLAVDGGYTAQ
jgi:NAD(P)-dependent dehydrogenase (short-subunit alcohol dehydrogenase family)